MSLRQLDRDEARQLAVRAQLLDATRPTDLVRMVDLLTLLQIDPTAAVAPNADLVAWSCLGSAYRPAELTRAVEQDRSLFELLGFLRPASALALHIPAVTAFLTQPSVSTWLEANEGFRRNVLARLRDVGPVLSRDIPDTSQVPWGSTGWTSDRNVTQQLELLSATTSVARARGGQGAGPSRGAALGGGRRCAGHRRGAEGRVAGRGARRLAGTEGQRRKLRPVSVLR